MTSNEWLFAIAIVAAGTGGYVAGREAGKREAVAACAAATLCDETDSTVPRFTAAPFATTISCESRHDPRGATVAYVVACPLGGRRPSNAEIKGGKCPGGAP